MKDINEHFTEEIETMKIYQTEIKDIKCSLENRSNRNDQHEEC